MSIFTREVVRVSFFIFISSTSFFANSSSFKEKSGDVLEVAMPLFTMGLSYYHDDNEGMKEFALALSGTVLTATLLKKSVSKERPDDSDDDAFPSGHAAITFSSASYLERRYGWTYGLPAYSLATWTAYTRLNSDQHQIEDVLAGAAIGYLFSYLLVEPNEEFFIAPVITKDNFALEAGFKF